MTYSRNSKAKRPRKTPGAKAADALAPGLSLLPLEGSSKELARLGAEAPSCAITPLELMLKVMHELYEEADRCASDGAQANDLFGAALINETRVKLLNMAAAVGKHIAPYMHPRLSAIEHTGKDGTPLHSGVLLIPGLLSVDEWEKAVQASQ